MSSPNKVVVGLAIVFAVSAMAIAAQLICVMRRNRRFFMRRSSGDQESVSNVSDIVPAHNSPTKELLYFFCWKNQSSRVEPRGGRTPSEAPLSRPSTTESDEDVEDIVKWHEAMLGNSRFLFTIKEEQEREVESDSLDGASNTGSGTIASAPLVEELRKRMSLREWFEAAKDIDVSVAKPLVADLEVSVTFVPPDATPFSTPCASPTFYTPTPSPARYGNDDSEEETAVSSVSDVQGDAAEFTTLDISGP